MPIQLNEAMSSLARGGSKKIVRDFLMRQKKDIVFTTIEVTEETGVGKDTLLKHKSSMDDLFFRMPEGNAIVWGNPDAIKKLKEMYAKQVG